MSAPAHPGGGSPMALTLCTMLRQYVPRSGAPGKRQAIPITAMSVDGRRSSIDGPRARAPAQTVERLAARELHVLEHSERSPVGLDEDDLRVEDEAFSAGARAQVTVNRR